MDASTRPETPDPTPDLIDPIGPPTLDPRPRYGARALALIGTTLGVALAANSFCWGTTTPPLN